MPIHKYSQFVLDREIRVPEIRVKANKRVEGVIKLRKELNLSDIKLEAFICADITYFHSSDPSFHSWYSPKIRTIAKIIIVIFVSNNNVNIVGIGIKSAISMSNTRNNTAKIKNRNENGIRAELWGSNPHSKGVAFSKLGVALLFKAKVARIIKIGNSVAITMAVKIIFIFLGVKILLMK